MSAPVEGPVRPEEGRTRGTRQLLELSAQIAWENFRARLNRVVNAESDNLYEPGAKPA